MLVRLGSMLVLLAALAGGFEGQNTARAQVLPGSASAEAAGASPELPEELSPEIIDQLMGKLSDEQVREILRTELVRRADEATARQDEGSQALIALQTRAQEMSVEIRSRLERWVGDIYNITNRSEEVEKRLARAENGVGGMITASLAVLLAGIGSAAVIHLMTVKWRRLLADTQTESYWEKVVRTLVLGVVEILPVVAFFFATQTVAPFWSAELGPLGGQIWIYNVGVTYSWVALVIARRFLTPRLRQIRIAPFSDEVALGTYRLLRQAVLIGAFGWIFGGFFPNLGLGFGPALMLVMFCGLAVAVLLALSVVRNRAAIQDTMGTVLNVQEQSGFLPRVVALATPALLIVYVVFAALFWVAHWIERGQHQLAGPLGTVIVVILLPIADRFGREVISSCMTIRSDIGVRMEYALHQIWRMIVVFVSLLVALNLWGLDIIALAKSEDASVWASTGFDIAITLLIGSIIWRLIRAALHSERKVSAGGEDDSENVQSSRFDTLTPLLRNTLLAFLATVIAMIILSSVGVDIGPLIASAGIVGIAVGFGAQTLVKDIFSGIFFLIDDAFRIGEYISLDEKTRGEVEAISIRSLQLRHHRGAVITVPFGELKQVTNHTRDWVIYKMSFRLEPDTDPQHVKKVVKRVGAEFLEHPEHGAKFINQLKSQGVHYIDDDSALVMRVKFTCVPRAQFILRREIYHRLRAVFAEEGIQFARRKVEVIGQEGNEAPVAIPPEELEKAAGANKPSADAQ